MNTVDVLGRVLSATWVPRVVSSRGRCHSVSGDLRERRGRRSGLRPRGHCCWAPSPPYGRRGQARAGAGSHRTGELYACDSSDGSLASSPVSSCVRPSSYTTTAMAWGHERRAGLALPGGGPALGAPQQWPGWRLPQDPQGVVLGRLRKAALEPGPEGRLPGVQGRLCRRSLRRAPAPRSCVPCALLCVPLLAPRVWVGPAVQGCCGSVPRGVAHLVSRSLSPWEPR